jgi:hypothetical protein
MNKYCLPSEKNSLICNPIKNKGSATTVAEFFYMIGLARVCFSVCRLKTVISALQIYGYYQHPWVPIFTALDTRISILQLR